MGWLLMEEEEEEEKAMEAMEARGSALWKESWGVDLLLRLRGGGDVSEALFVWRIGRTWAWRMEGGVGVPVE